MSVGRIACVWQVLTALSIYSWMRATAGSAVNGCCVIVVCCTRAVKTYAEEFDDAMVLLAEAAEGVYVCCRCGGQRGRHGCIEVC